MTSVNYSITMETDNKDQLSALASKTGGWSDHDRFFMESKQRLARFKAIAKELKLKIAEIEETKYSDYGDELSCKVIYRG